MLNQNPGPRPLASERTKKSMARQFDTGNFTSYVEGQQFIKATEQRDVSVTCVRKYLTQHSLNSHEIEKALVKGDIQVANVPALWDTHWGLGMVGYFPTYILDSIYAVQIFDTAKEAIPNLDEHLAKGEFHVLKKWLNENINEQGSLKESGDDLIFALTGKHLDSSLYVKYLTDKYTFIYDL
ncbi:hypothetical protein BGZ95_011916 [Linnemannia exigua]|uniref:Carboxypeptidase n=1 Tax=Linnemannia exigua TaxID=604196 RepID=A0AAD4D9Q5_9FUNG|nr:hypothetical protein BGZ95_011916 [Linnemannia exigua]